MDDLKPEVPNTPASTEIKLVENKPVGELFTLIQDITDKLTLKRILTALLTGLLVTCTALLYENRDVLFQKSISSITGPTGTPRDWVLSKQSTEDLRKLVINSELVKFIRVNEVDIPKNRRIQRFWFLQDPDEAKITEKLEAQLPQSMFDYDPKNTLQMVSVLNNEFPCAKYADTSFIRMLPELSKRTNAVCFIAIPPFYGQFVGMISVGLAYEPTKDELDSLKIELSRLAVEIYLRDIKKQSRL